jgi:hypothetical protein
MKELRGNLRFPLYRRYPSKSFPLYRRASPVPQVFPVPPVPFGHVSYSKILHRILIVVITVECCRTRSASDGQACGTLSASGPSRVMADLTTRTHVSTCPEQAWPFGYVFNPSTIPVEVALTQDAQLRLFNPHLSL